MQLKRHLIHNFSRAAQHYDQAASLQQQVGTQLFMQFPPNWQPQILLDAGAGTGYFSKQLTQQYPNAHIMSLDIAPSMSQQAKQKVNQVVTADFDALPLPNYSLCCAWVANCIDPNMAVLTENIDTLRSILPAPLLGVVPYGAKPEQHLDQELLRGAVALPSPDACFCVGRRVGDEGKKA